jgi:hypothetical protein
MISIEMCQLSKLRRRQRRLTVETAIVGEAPSAPTKLSFPPLAPGSYCDPTFVGDPITFMQTSEMTLEMLIDQIHTRFGLTF